MQAVFFRSDDGSESVATAWWHDGHVSIDAPEADAKRALKRIFRATPVVVDDPSYRSLGAHGEVVIQPGSLEWFRAAAYHRAPGEGLTVRLVPHVTGQGGWDPAAAYRTFRETVRRQLEGSGEPAGPQPGETEPEERAETGDRPRASDSPHNVQ